MMLSRGCEYALRATLYLVSLEEPGFVPIRRLSKDLDIEFHFLTKLFQQLAERGLIQSQRGPRGGVALALPSERVRPLDIVLAIDGPELFRECVLGLPGCGDQTPCPLHAAWAAQRDGIHSMFETTTLRDMAANLKSEKYRLRAVIR